MEINSHEWYEKVYHAPKRCPVFSDYLKSAEDRNYRGRFVRMISDFILAVDTPGIKTALEIGGHLGKTAYWLKESLAHISLDIMDFSEPAIEYMRKNIGSICNNIFQSDVDCIHAASHTYDLITCIDVSEHLTESVYFGMLSEISRILKKTGHCILYGSMARHNSHINIRNPATIIKDADGLLKFVKMLPGNHILFKGIE